MLDRNQRVNCDDTNVRSYLSILYCISRDLPKMHSWRKRIQPSSIFLYEEWTSKNVCGKHIIIIFDTQNFVCSADLDAPSSHPPTLYDLLANVTHESVAGTTRDKEHTIWKVHLRAAGGGGDSEKWFQIQDLIVEEIRKEMIFLGESVIQVGHLLRGVPGTRADLSIRYGNGEQVHHHTKEGWTLDKPRCIGYDMLQERPH